MATVTQIASGRWNIDAATVWDTGTAPTATDRVICSAGMRLTVEGDCYAGHTRTTSNAKTNAALVIEGELYFSRTDDSDLIVDGQAYIQHSSNLLDGFWNRGTDADPIPAGVISKRDANPSGVYVAGYVNGIYGSYSGASSHIKFYEVSGVKRVRNTYITSLLAAGGSAFDVNDATGWQVGDELFLSVAPTSNVNPHLEYNSQYVTIIAITGTSITVSQSVTAARGDAIATEQPQFLVVNTTSNVYDYATDSTNFYCLNISRPAYRIDNKVDYFANNRYNLHTGTKIISAGTYGREAVYISSGRISDGSNMSDHVESLYFPTSPKTTAVHDDLFFIQQPRAGYRGRAPLHAYYGGLVTLFTNCSFSGHTTYLDAGVSAYQQPVTLQNCIVACANIGYLLHNNRITHTVDSWAVGCSSAAVSYNGDSVHTDLRIRWCKALATFQNAWDGGVTFIRPDFILSQTATGNIQNITNPNTSPGTSSVAKFIDIVGDPTQQREFGVNGQHWQENTETRTSLPFALGMKSTHATKQHIAKLAFGATAGQSLPVLAYVKNYNSVPFAGDLIVSLEQGGVVLSSSSYDLSTFTDEEWGLISVAGTSLLNKDVEVVFKYSGIGQIVIADQLFPPAPNEISQANATLTALQADGTILNRLDGMIEDVSGDRWTNKALEVVDNGNDSGGFIR